MPLQIFPAIKHVLDKFRHKLPKDELKRLGKDLAKKLVASDYKNQRVSDPSAPLSEKQSQKIKKYTKDYLDKAVFKYNEHKDKAQKPAGDESSKKQEDGTASATPQLDSPAAPDLTETPSDMDRKRKREDDGQIAGEGSQESRNGGTDDDKAPTPPNENGREAKRAREDEVHGEADAVPPPPPPPPAEDDGALREQEEALMRENEEAQRLEDAGASTTQQPASQNQEVMSH